MQEFGNTKVYISFCIWALITVGPNKPNIGASPQLSQENLSRDISMDCSMLGESIAAREGKNACHAGLRNAMGWTDVLRATALANQNSIVGLA